MHSTNFTFFFFLYLFFISNYVLFFFCCNYYVSHTTSYVYLQCIYLSFAFLLFAKNIDNKKKIRYIFNSFFLFFFFVSVAFAQTAINSITTGIIMKLLYCTIHLAYTVFFFYFFYVTYAVFNVRYFPISLFIAHCDEFFFFLLIFFNFFYYFLTEH